MLAEVVARIYEGLQSSRAVPNPVDEAEDLNRIDVDHWAGLMSALHALSECSRRAQEAQDEAAAALTWSEAFSYLMPLPDAEEVEIVEEESDRALMQLPVITVDVFIRQPRRPIGSFFNEVPRVAEDCDLEFRITNPHIIPQYAEVEWTVRNSEDEAAEVGDLGDLGHRPKACGRGPWIGISREEDDELVVVRASGCRADGEDQSRRWRAAGWDREEAGAAPLDGGGEGSDRAGDGAHRGGDARDRAAARCAREHAEAVACAVSSG